MISFYPGPSRVYDQIPRYVADAGSTGVLSMNHRSAEGMQLVKLTTRALQQKLGIPKSYTILFTSSATECWEIVAQSLVRDTSVHIGNGAFAQKWFTYTQALRPPGEFRKLDLETPVPIITTQAELICLTQNETSTGTQVSMETIRALQAANPHSLIAVDATSSLGGIALDFTAADVWFASVQKCLGLPAGLGLLICSPRAVERARQLQEKSHYNSLVNQLAMAALHQTTHTPNVLGIYLLYRVMQAVSPIRTVHKRIVQQAQLWYAFFEQHPKLKALVQNPEVRSHTVIAVTAEAAIIKKVKQEARKAGLLLGEGYGPWKETTFRIANFPALKPAEIKKLMRFLAGLK